jgi:hypothetical protein
VMADSSTVHTNYSNWHFVLSWTPGETETPAYICLLCSLPASLNSGRVVEGAHRAAPERHGNEGDLCGASPC